MPPLPLAATQFIEATDGRISHTQPVGGGCINTAYKIITPQSQYFLKTHKKPPLEFFEAEACGLKALKAHGVSTPDIYLIDEHFLLLNYVESGKKQLDYNQHLAHQLAKLHLSPQPYFGFSQPTYCGLTLQPNKRYNNGIDFFAEQKLLMLGQLLFNTGKFDKTTLKQLEQFCGALPDLLPTQPASLIHGDLWQGNIFTDEQGLPMLIDPAVYYGWAEAELAMTALFGQLPEAFFEAYYDLTEKQLPDIKRWQERKDIYNLYHLLNHLHLFGGSYYHQCLEIMKRYS